jgi:hypothetical protein
VTQKSGTMMKVDSFFEMLWKDYVQIAPQAQKIQDIFTGLGETVFNDHVAFRTFSDSPIDLDHLEPVILKMGYRLQNTYHFEEKKLIARSYSHSEADLPRIFLSELRRDLLSKKAQEILSSLVEQISEDVIEGPEIFAEGLLWRPIPYKDYSQLLQESEYAAWLVSMGLRVNHFTVSVNHLKQLVELEQVIALLKENGYLINQAGGEIKGVPSDLLIQASTLADRVNVTYGCGHVENIPSCFYEFAKRFEDAEGRLFDGFIEGNADKIFESTNMDRESSD